MELPSAAVMQLLCQLARWKCHLPYVIWQIDLWAKSDLLIAPKNYCTAPKGKHNRTKAEAPPHHTALYWCGAVRRAVPLGTFHTLGA
jgi:hypothetical protein